MAMETQTETWRGEGGKAVHGVRKPYLLVFVFLAIITIIEVQIPSSGQSIGLQRAEQIVFLMGTAVAKGALVALYYMHLKYEPLVLRYVPLVPLGLAATPVLAPRPRSSLAPAPLPALALVVRGSPSPPPPGTRPADPRGLGGGGGKWHHRTTSARTR